MKVRDFLRAHEAGSDSIKYIKIGGSVYDPWDSNLIIRMYGNENVDKFSVDRDELTIFIDGDRLEVEEDFDRFRRYRRR